MQEQRSTVESLPEAFDFDHAPGSSPSAIDRQMFWNNVPDYLISPAESNISYGPAVNHHETESSPGWHSGASSSRDHLMNENICEEIKMEGGNPSRRLNMNRVGINLNRAHEGEDQELRLSPAGGDGLVTQNGIYSLYNTPFTPQAELPSSLEGRRLSGKRKSMEGDSGQSSGSFHQTESSFLNGVATRNVSSSSGFENAARAEQEIAESSHRSFRMRLNPSPGSQADVPSDWRQTATSSGGQATIWSPPQPSSLLAPATQALEVRLSTPNLSSSHGQPQQIPALGFPRLVLPAARTVSSGPILPEQSSLMRRINNNTASENPMFIPAAEARVVGQLPAQLPVDWGLAHGNSASSAPVGSMAQRAHYHNLPAQYPRALSEFVRRTFPIANSDPSGQPGNLNPQRLVQSHTPEIAPPQGVGFRAAHQHPLLRSAFLMDRRPGVMGAPLAVRTLAASREGRSRMISEHIRNALDLMRRGENLRFEDVLILDHSAFYGLADLHDRHRDMRLDVDNMSYEELLALEERIGNVNTGLSEEVILKHLKHKTHPPSSLVKSPDDTPCEPCCICQEDYVEGEQIGLLECGHEFHSACIKQWLAHKNICPICKMTALVT